MYIWRLWISSRGLLAGMPLTQFGMVCAICMWGVGTHYCRWFLHLLVGHQCFCCPGFQCAL